MKTVLVVDDEYDLLQTICATLEFGGYEPVQASNGRIALEKIAEAKPDLVLTDVMMPYMSGYDLVARIRRLPEGRALPTILMSSIDPSLHPSGEWNKVLAKPFSLDKLLTAVQELIGEGEVS